MTLIKQIFADLSNCKSTKYNQWSSVASASSACHFIFRHTPAPELCPLSNQNRKRITSFRFAQISKAKSRNMPTI